MSKAQHTPGPWNARYTPFRGGHDDIWCIDWSADQEEVAEIVHGEANACLIAAAPELLAVVIELQESAEYWSEYDVPIGIVDRIRAAIAKAEGK